MWRGARKLGKSSPFKKWRSHDFENGSLDFDDVWVFCSSCFPLDTLEIPTPKDYNHVCKKTLKFFSIVT